VRKTTVARGQEAVSVRRSRQVAIVRATVAKASRTADLVEDCAEVGSGLEQLRERVVHPGVRRHVAIVSADAETATVDEPDLAAVR
jgi:hypothetical protein